MAAFTAADPHDRAAFDIHWAKIIADRTIVLRTILYRGQIAGSIVSHRWFGEPEISYWLGRAYWGQGVASGALARFLAIEMERPLFARVAFDNVGSQRVLEKCGFVRIGQEQGYANARSGTIDQFVYRLDAATEST